MRIIPFLVIFIELLLFAVTAYCDQRIIGGTEARAGQFYFTASIQVQTANSRFFCGGTLIRSRWILTSGNCVYNATLFTIEIGSTSLTEVDPNRLTFSSSEYVLHPDFDPEKIGADVGLIKLRTNQTQFYPYSYNGDFYVPAIEDNSPVVVLGWGQTSDSDAGLSDKLQYVELSTLSNEECKMVYGEQITDEMVCVAGNYNEGTCTGDNGGALLQKYGHYYVVGIASFISANGCESTNPSGFTRTAPYYKWLDATMTWND